MWDRFTDRARLVMAYARRAAERAGSDAIGTEHMLAGLLEDGEGLGCQALAELGVDLVLARSEAEAFLRGGGKPSGELSFTLAAKKALEHAIDRARALKNNHVGTEHLLLGLLDAHGGGVRACPSLAALDAGGFIAKVTALQAQCREASREPDELPIAGEDAARMTGPVLFLVRLWWSYLLMRFHEGERMFFALGLCSETRLALLNRGRLQPLLARAEHEQAATGWSGLLGVVLLFGFANWLRRINVPMANFLAENPAGFALLLAALGCLGVHVLLAFDLRRRALAIWAARSAAAKAVGEEKDVA